MALRNRWNGFGDARRATGGRGDDDDGKGRGRNDPRLRGPHDFDDFDPQLDGFVGQRAALYDSFVYPAAGLTQISLFQEQIGQGTSWTGGGVKNYSDTNMELPGQLPRGKQFLVQSIELHFLPIRVAGWGPAEKDSAHSPAIVNDAYVFRTSGSLRFTIGSVDIIREGPLLRFPAKTHFEVKGALADTTTAGANQLSFLAIGEAYGRPYIMHPYDETLRDGMNFGVQLLWEEGAQALPSGQTARVVCVLDGVLGRSPM